MDTPPTDPKAPVQSRSRPSGAVRAAGAPVGRSGVVPVVRGGGRDRGRGPSRLAGAAGDRRGAGGARGDRRAWRSSRCRAARRRSRAATRPHGRRPRCPDRHPHRHDGPAGRRGRRGGQQATPEGGATPSPTEDAGVDGERRRGTRERAPRELPGWSGQDGDYMVISSRARRSPARRGSRRKRRTRARPSASSTPTISRRSTAATGSCSAAPTRARTRRKPSSTTSGRTTPTPTSGRSRRKPRPPRVQPFYRRPCERVHVHRHASAAGVSRDQHRHHRRHRAGQRAEVVAALEHEPSGAPTPSAARRSDAAIPANPASVTRQVASGSSRWASKPAEISTSSGSHSRISAPRRARRASGSAASPCRPARAGSP